MTDDFHFYLLRRADDYVTAIRPTADIDRFGFQAWHGWAINKAWRDGYDAAINDQPGGGAVAPEQAKAKKAGVASGPPDPIAAPDANVLPCLERGCPNPSMMPESEYCRYHAARMPPENAQPDDVDEVTRTAPTHIWLCVSDDAQDADVPFPDATGDEVTWSLDRYFAVCVKYERADLAANALRREKDRAVEARDGWYMANGVADLAMKHRDAAEADRDRLAAECERLREQWQTALADRVELLARCERAERERDALRHDIERLTATNAELATECDALRKALDTLTYFATRLHTMSDEELEAWLQAGKAAAREKP